MKNPIKVPPQRPSKVRIMGREYRFHYVEPSPLQNANFGITNNANQDIYVEDQQSPIEEADTVFHESLHGVCYSMKLGLNHETEEKVVSTLATGILGMLQDNPEFAAWLCEDKSLGGK